MFDLRSKSLLSWRVALNVRCSGLRDPQKKHMFVCFSLFFNCFLFFYVFFLFLAQYSAFQLLSSEDY